MHVHPEDVPLIKQTRVRYIRTAGKRVWIFSPKGQYSVKSGYHQLSKQSIVNISDAAQHKDLWKRIWALKIPPKLQHFWWKILHNALPVAANLARLRIKLSRDCVLCGEEEESIMHLLFHCRVAREIWELSPLHIPPGQFLNHSTPAHVIHDLIFLQSRVEYNVPIFPFIG